MPKPSLPGVVAVYAHLDEALAGIKALQQEGLKSFEVISPVPHHEITHLLHRKPSPVRAFTLAGGLLGLVIGWGLARLIITLLPAPCATFPASCRRRNGPAWWRTWPGWRASTPGRN